MAMMLIELDDFGAVRASRGRQVADELLCAAAERIQSCVRAEDIAGRLAGNQFLVLLRDLADIAAARTTAQRVSDVLARPTRIVGATAGCRASIGLAFTDVRSELPSLFRQADTAHYTARAQGKGRWLQFSDDMPTPTRLHVEARRVLDEAFEQERMSLRYQPIVELASGYPIGFEALLRIDTDTHFSITDLIAAAESTDLIHALGEWVINHALADLPRLNPPGPTEPRYVSVNVSSYQLRRPDFALTVRSALSRRGTDPHRLVLEITERVLVDDQRAWASLADLRRIGVRVAIYDFGTGYATLSYRRQPAIDIIKIDHSFLEDIASPRACILLQAVIGLAQTLGLDHVVEIEVV